MEKRKTDLSKYNNRWYRPRASVIKRGLWLFINACFFNSYLFPFNSLKLLLIRLFGARVGKGVVIKPSVNIKYPWRLKIGSNVWVGENVWIDNLSDVSIADHVCLSQGAMLLTGNHNYKKAEFDLMTGDIILEEGVWIGTKSIVCPGVTCKSHSVLTVGSVATKGMEAYCVYQGNPAVKVADRVIE